MSVVPILPVGPIAVTVEGQDNQPLPEYSVQPVLLETISNGMFLYHF